MTWVSIHLLMILPFAAVAHLLVFSAGSRFHCRDVYDISHASVWRRGHWLMWRGGLWWKGVTPSVASDGRTLCPWFPASAQTFFKLLPNLVGLFVQEIPVLTAKFWNIFFSSSLPNEPCLNLRWEGEKQALLQWKGSSWCSTRLTRPGSALTPDLGSAFRKAHVVGIWGYFFSSSAMTTIWFLSALWSETSLAGRSIGAFLQWVAEQSVPETGASSSARACGKIPSRSKHWAGQKLSFKPCALLEGLLASSNASSVMMIWYLSDTSGGSSEVKRLKQKRAKYIHGLKRVTLVSSAARLVLETEGKKLSYWSLNF